MATGPSKEELDMYWTNSRQYFDELANYYKSADPEYYNRFIAPYYSNPFAQVSASKPGTGIKRSLIFLVAVMVLVLTAGIAVFFFTVNEQEKTESNKYEKQIETSKENTKPVDKDIEKILSNDDFIIGSKYLADKDYDKAEEHLKKVKPGDEYYEQAQQLLESMKYLRKYNK